MTNENEDIRKEDAEHTEAPKHHTSWLGNIIDKIQDLDTDFPLSGGEEDPRPAHHHDETKPAAIPNPGDPEHIAQPEHHTSFIRHIIEEIEHKIDKLDTDFPLSGGEESMDFHLGHHHKKTGGNEEEGGK